MLSTHLSGGKVNISRIQDHARNHLFALLDKIDGTKVLPVYRRELYLNLLCLLETKTFVTFLPFFSFVICIELN